jgi:hypothetical protein
VSIALIDQGPVENGLIVNGVEWPALIARLNLSLFALRGSRANHDAAHVASLDDPRAATCRGRGAVPESKSTVLLAIVP